MNSATTTTSTSGTLRKVANVVITSDLMCPWCWVGLRKLQEASQRTNIDLQITWKPFQLRPNIPVDGMPKGGTPSSRVGDHLRSAGESVGINFTGLTDRTPNTLLFHAVMKMLNESENDMAEGKSDAILVQNKQTSFQEATFEAYFTLGIFPNEGGLLQCAEKAGVMKEVQSLFEDSERLERYQLEARKEAKEASISKGISGVPHFEFNGNPAFSGAQDVSTFAEFLNHYAE